MLLYKADNFLCNSFYIQGFSQELLFCYLFGDDSGPLLLEFHVSFFVFLEEPEISERQPGLYFCMMNLTGGILVLKIVKEIAIVIHEIHELTD